LGKLGHAGGVPIGGRRVIGAGSEGVPHGGGPRAGP
jgi:hypothetical protein